MNKLDASLSGLITPPSGKAVTTSSSKEHQEGAYQVVTGQGTDKVLSIKKDKDGRDLVDVLINTDGSLSGFVDQGVVIHSVVGAVVAAQVPVDALGRVTSLSNVRFIEPSRPGSPTNDRGVASTNAPSFRNRTGKDGSGVIIGLIDTGIDFTHQDFRKADGTTRIMFICDQTDAPQAGDITCDAPAATGGLGTLWSETQINAALQSGTGVRQVDSNGHGTHVLGSAAGDDATFGGMAPGADLIVVKTSFFTNDNVAAIGFINDLAALLLRPYVINMSLGGHFGPHDGTDATSAAIDSLTGAGKPGKAVVVAAGNEGNINIHASGSVTQGGAQQVSFNVPAGTQVSLISLWYGGQESFCFNFIDPQGGGLGSCVNPGASTGTLCRPNPSVTCVSIDHTSTLAINNSKQVFFQIVTKSAAGPNATIDVTGTWNFTMSGNPVGAGRFDAWSQCFTPTSSSLCTFTSSHGNTDLTVAESGVSRNAITVGSYVTKSCWQNSSNQTLCYSPPATVGGISSFSSKGSIRDGRIKPDIAGPGQAVVSSKSKAATFSPQLTDPGGRHVRLQGTSMASPHVAGAVALLLAEDPSRDAAQIKALLQGRALKDAFTGNGCNNTWGCGKLQLEPVLSSIVVTPSTPSIPKGAAQQFTAVGTFTDGASDNITNDVTWSSSNTGVATISNSAGSKGLATAVAASGSTNIRASMGGKTSNAGTLTVTAPVLQSIAVNPGAVSLPKGTSQQFTAMGTLTDGTTASITDTATWTSSNPSVATVSNAAGSKGLATSVSSGGNSQIKAAQGGQEGTATVTATPPVLQSIAVSPSAASIPKGGAQQFSAVGTLTDGTTGNLTNTAAWNSSNTSVATVNASGLATGLNPGTSQIKASQSGKEGVATLTVSGEATVQGRVILQGRSNHSGAAVSFTGQNPVVTDAAGNFQLQLPTGTYEVRVEKDGFLRATRAGLVVSQNLALPPVTLSAGDVNGDGVIDVRDLSLGGGNLGKSQSPWP